MTSIIPIEIHLDITACLVSKYRFDISQLILDQLTNQRKKTEAMWAALVPKAK